MTVDISTLDLPPAVGERHILQPQEELRVEVAFGTASAQFCLQKGSCELWGCELALGKVYSIANGGLKLALFTWHGCVLDVEADVEISYQSDETDAQLAYINTHAQLEALRDDAAARNQQGPRVMIVGPPESGKSSLAQTLIGYATKVGRTPLWVDLDPLDNAMSVPGTLAVAPMTASGVTVETYAAKCGIPPNTGVHPLVVWHGSNTKLHPDLFRAQVDTLAHNINQRLLEEENARYSGIIVNTNGWIQDEGYPLLLHAADALDISVILILGHDRLYSMMTNHYKKQPPPPSSQQQTTTTKLPPKILKLPRSGGVVSRPQPFVRSARSRAVKRYFYGDLVDPPKIPTEPSSSSMNNNMNNNNGPSTQPAPSTTPTLTVSQKKVPQLTPFLVHLNFADLDIYKVSSMALSSSLLPVAQQQSTDAIQIVKLDLETEAESLQHALLAVCHPSAVQAYTNSGRARDLVTAGVAGFCAVERVVTDTDTLHLLSPCAGSLPSKTLLLGDITWME
jgi:polyribonucleotide 5'-hydroxyl-kinase